MVKLSGSELEKLKDKTLLLEKRIAREIKSREAAETLLESKSRELFQLNKWLSELNGQLKLQVDKNNQFLEAINEFGLSLVGKNNLNEIAWVVSEKLMHKYNLDNCFIYALKDNQCYQITPFEDQENAQQDRFKKMKIPLGAGIVGAVAASGKGEIINDTSQDKRYRINDVFRNSELTVPITYEGTTIGIIDSEHTEKNFFNDDHFKFFSLIANIISLLFKNSLIEQNNQDLRTGIRKNVHILDSVVDNLHTGVLLFDEQDKIAMINSEFKRIFKIPFEDKNIIGVDQVQAAKAYKGSFSASDKFYDFVDKAKTIKKKTLIKGVELKNGSIIDCDFIPLMSNQDYIGQLWQVRDVTREFRFNERIERSEEKYRGLIENMHLGLLEVDHEHKILRAYDWFCDMFGYTEQEIIGKNAIDLFSADRDQIKLINYHSDLRLEGRPSSYEVQLRKKSGVLIWVIISGAPLFDEQGKMVGSLGIHFDITDRKNLESEIKKAYQEAEISREAEKAFLANMSHEIRNPLNAIIGLTHLLYDTKPTQKQLSHLEGLKHSSSILMGLISNVLDLSKIESGVMELSGQSLNIKTIIDSLLKIVGFNLDRKSIKYLNKLSQEGNFQVIADPVVINQIFLNLLSNATKFTQRGSIEVYGEPISVKGDKTNFRFSIKDTGIGISTSLIHDIFNSFKQADGDTKLKYGGTGLGLSIVKNLIAMYDGEIKVKSQPDQGAEFTFNLWLSTANYIETIPEQESFSAAHEGLILIVEDNQFNQQYLAGVLENWGFKFDLASNGKEALTLTDNQYYHLILMDIRMPIMDGYEFAIRLRDDQSNRNKTVPIIALTASALIDERDKAMRAGMNYHITKPFEVDDIKVIFLELGLLNNALSEDNKSYQLDQNILTKYYGGDRGRATVMFELFLKTIDLDFDAFLTAFSTTDLSSMKALAHKMRPNFAMVGLEIMSDKLHEIESIIEVKDLNKINLRPEELRMKFEKQKKEVKDQLNLMRSLL
jgi:PAS domain S-box-containing protein